MYMYLMYMYMYTLVPWSPGTGLSRVPTGSPTGEIPFQKPDLTWELVPTSEPEAIYQFPRRNQTPPNASKKQLGGFIKM